MASSFSINSVLQVQLGTTWSNLREQIKRAIGGPVKLDVSVDSASVASSALNNLKTQATALRPALASAQDASRNFSSALTIIKQNAAQGSNALELFGNQTGLAARRFLAFSVAAGAMVKFVVAIKQGLAEAINFETQMVKLAQVSGATSGQIAKVEQQISGLSTAFGVSSKDLAEAAVLLKQAGLSYGEVASSLSALAKAALAPNFGSLKDTTEAIIAVYRQFKISASEAESVLGSINAVAGDFAVEAEDITIAIKKAGGAFATLAGDANSGKEALNQFVALFTSVRATTREDADAIATGLRTIFSRLQRPEVVESLQHLGIQLRFTKQQADQLGQSGLENQFVGAYEAVERLSEGLSKLRSTDPRFTSIIEELGGTRQISRVLPLIQQFGEAQKALSVAQVGQTSVSIAAEKAQESLANRLSRTREEFLALFRSIEQSSGFRALIGFAATLGDNLARLLEFAKPLIPLLTTLALIKVGSGLANFVTSFGGGFLGNVTKQPQTVKRASGGFVPGVGSTDSVHAMLTPGEFVIRKDVAQQYKDELPQLNMGGYFRDRYADGGVARGRANFAKFAKIFSKKHGLDFSGISQEAFDSVSDRESFFTHRQIDPTVDLNQYVDTSVGLSKVLSRLLKGDKLNEAHHQASIPFGFPTVEGNLHDFLLRGDKRALSYIKKAKATSNPFNINTDDSYVAGLEHLSAQRDIFRDYLEEKFGPYDPKAKFAEGGITNKLSQADVINATVNYLKNLSKQYGVNFKSAIPGGVYIYPFTDKDNVELGVKDLGTEDGKGVAAGYYRDSKRAIGLNSNLGFNPHILTHELGHAVDYSLKSSPTSSLDSYFNLQSSVERGNNSALLDFGNYFGNLVGSSLEGPNQKRVSYLKKSRELKADGFAAAITGKYSAYNGIKRLSPENLVDLQSRFAQLIPIFQSQFGKFAKGGDVVPAMLTPGEFVVTKDRAQQVGYDRLKEFNRTGKLRGYASGGTVGYAKGGATDRTVSITDIPDKLFDEAIAHLQQQLDKAGKSMASLGNNISFVIREIEKVGKSGKTKKVNEFIGLSPETEGAIGETGLNSAASLRERRRQIRDAVERQKRAAGKPAASSAELQARLSEIDKEYTTEGLTENQKGRLPAEPTKEDILNLARNRAKVLSTIISTRGRARAGIDKPYEIDLSELSKESQKKALRDLKKIIGKNSVDFQDLYNIPAKEVALEDKKFIRPASISVLAKDIIKQKVTGEDYTVSNYVGLSQGAIEKASEARARIEAKKAAINAIRNQSGEFVGPPKPPKPPVATSAPQPSPEPRRNRGFFPLPFQPRGLLEGGQRGNIENADFVIVSNKKPKLLDGKRPVPVEPSLKLLPFAGYDLLPPGENRTDPTASFNFPFGTPLNALPPPDLRKTRIPGGKLSRRVIQAAFEQGVPLSDIRDFSGYRDFTNSSLKDDLSTSELDLGPVPSIPRDTERRERDREFKRNIERDNKRRLIDQNERLRKNSIGGLKPGSSEFLYGQELDEVEGKLVPVGIDPTQGRIGRKVKEEINRRGGVVSNQTRAEITQEQQDLAVKDLISAERRLVAALNKNISEVEVERIARENVDQALRTEAKVIYSKNGKALGTESNVNAALAAGVPIPGSQGGFSRIFGGLLDSVKAIPKIFTEPVQSLKNIFGGISSVFSRLGPTALFAAPYIGELFKNGTPESAAATGSGAYARGQAISGGLQGGLIGGVVTNAFTKNPIAIGIGSVIGAIQGITTSLEQAEREIRQVKLGNALDIFSERISALANGVEAGTISSDALTELKNIQKLSQEENFSTAKRRVLGVPVGFDTDQYVALQNKSERQTFGSQLPAIQRSLLNQAEKLAKNNTEAKPQELAGKLLDSELNRELIQLSSRIRNVPVSEVLREFADNIRRFQKAEEIERANKERLKSEGQLINNFTRLSTSVEAASDSLIAIRTSLELTGELFNNNFSASKVTSGSQFLGELGRPGTAISQPLGILGGTGKAGAELVKTATLIDEIAGRLPSILGESARQAPVEGEDIPSRILNKLRGQLGSRNDENVINVLRGKLNDVSGGGDSGKLRQLISNDAGKLTEEIISSLADPIKKTGGEAAKALEGEANRFIEGLSQLRQQIVSINESLYNAARATVARQRNQAEIFADRAGRSRQVEDLLPLSLLDRPFNLRQTNLNTGVGNPFNPDELGDALRKTLVQVAEAEKNQQKVFETTGGGVKDGGKANAAASLQLTILKDRAANLAQALKFLAEASERNANIQEKLNKIEQDKQSRFAFGSRFLTAEPDQQQEINRGLLLANQVNNRGGSIQGLAQPDIKLLLETVQSLGNSKLTGFTGQPIASDLYEKILEKAGFGLDNKIEGQKTDLQNLQLQIFASAEKAANVFAEVQKTQSDTFFTTLTNLHSQFFVTLGQYFLRDEKRGLENRRTSLQADEGKFNALTEGKGTLAKLGITTDEQFKRFSENVPLIEQYGNIKRINAEKRKQIESFTEEGNITSLFESISGSDLSRKEKKARFADEFRKNLGGVLSDEQIDRLVENLDSNKVRSQVRGTALFALNQQENSQLEEVRKGFRTSGLDTEKPKGFPFQDIPTKFEQGLNQFLGTKESADALFNAVKQFKDSKQPLETLTSAASGAAAELEKVRAALKEINDKLGIKTTKINLPFGLNPVEVEGRAGGGFAPRGTDTVPAMLTPGEFIVNRDSAKTNIDLLRRINSNKGLAFNPQDRGNGTGDTPTRYLAEGGPADLEKVYDENGDPIRFSREELDKLTRPKTLEEQRLEHIRRVNPQVLFDEQGNPAIETPRQRLARERNEHIQRIKEERLRGNRNVPNIPLGPSPFVVEPPKVDAGKLRAGIEQGLLDINGDPIPGALEALQASQIREQQLREQDRQATLGSFANFNKLARYSRVPQRPGDEGEINIGARLQQVSNEQDALALRRNFDLQRVRKLRLANRFAEGGSVPGSGNGDTVPAMLTPGEFVLSREAVGRLGNSRVQRFNKGGSVGYYASGGSVDAGSQDITRAFAQFSVSAAIFNTSITNFVNTASNLNGILGGFSTSADKLAKSLENFPSTLNVSGSQTVNLVINGGEALARLTPEFQKMMQSYVNDKLTEVFKTNFPDAAVKIS